MEKNSFVFYRSFAEQLQKLPCDQFYRIMKHIFDYVFDGVVDEMETIDSVIFGLIKPQLDANNQRYQNGCKGAEFGKLGGRPKKPQENPTETPKKPQENPTETHNDNVNDNVNDNEKEKGTYVPKKKEAERTDGQEDENNEKVEKTLDFDSDRAKRQKEFFQLYPNVVVDNYSAADYADVDFEVLILRFEESAFLRATNSFAWICKNWRKIEAGEYRDFDKRTIQTKQQSHSQSKSKLGSEWDDLD